MTGIPNPDTLTPASASKRVAKVQQKPPTLWNSESMVKLYSGTGDDATLFNIHRDFATYHSPVLKAAFESNFVEGETQTYHFEDKFNENVIRLLVHWIYTKEFDLTQLRNIETKVTLQEPMFNVKSKNLAKLWVLAEMLLMPKLQNMVIAELEKITNEENRVVPLDLCKWIYKNTGGESSLRAWLVFTYAFEFVEHREDLPPEMLNDMVRLYKKDLKANGGEQVKDMEDYKVPEDTA